MVKKTNGALSFTAMDSCKTSYNMIQHRTTYTTWYRVMTWLNACIVIHSWHGSWDNTNDTRCCNMECYDQTWCEMMQRDGLSCIVLQAEHHTDAHGLIWSSKMVQIDANRTDKMGPAATSCNPNAAQLIRMKWCIVTRHDDPIMPHNDPTWRQ